MCHSLNRLKASHIKTFNKLNFPKIDFVVVNLYPFHKLLSKNKNKRIEMIDIGGVTLLRSAAKNFSSVTPVCDVSDYKKFSINLRNNHGNTSLQFRKKMATKVYFYTASYDLCIFNWLNNNETSSNLDYNKNELRYGENPHQKGFYYNKKNNKSIYDGVMQLGKALSYNNLLDINSALECINEFNEPTCVIIKHNNPCGVASSKNIASSFQNAYLSDKISAFGGIIILNRKLNTNLSKIISNIFFEIILAPSFSPESKKIFGKKKKLILIETNILTNEKDNEIKKIHGGFLTQQKNTIRFSKKNLKLVSNTKGSTKLIEDMVFAFKICKHTKSNSIVLVKNKSVVSMGIGQTSRIDSTKISLAKLGNKNKNIGYVAASDAFFPFIDSIKLLIKNNCKAVIQPAGSINDLKIIKFANEKKIPLYFSKYRFFRH